MKRTLFFIAGLFVIAVLFGRGVSAGPPLDDGAIVGIYNQVNSFDIETALLGETRGESEQVKKLAKMVASDHTGVRRSANDLASEVGVIPTLPAARAQASAEHDAVVADLRTKSGSEFDRAYLKHEIFFHRSAIDAVRTVLMPQAKNPRLREHFAKVLPAFEHHLAQTEQVAKQLGVQ
jgi:putative membrane protein